MTSEGGTLPMMNQETSDVNKATVDMINIE